MWKRRVALTLTAAAFFGGSIWTLKGFQRSMTTIEYLSVPAPQTAKALAAGYENMMANMLYLQFIHYFGKHMRWKQKFHNLYPVLSLMTDLDPKFAGAYVMGSLALGDNGQVDESEVLWQKAVEANPDDWEVAYQAGMSLFLFGDRPDQYLRAAKLFAKAAAHPQASPACRYMEARMYQTTNRRDMAIKIWQDTYLTSPSQEAREVAKRTLEKMKAPIPEAPATP